MTDCARYPLQRAANRWQAWIGGERRIDGEVVPTSRNGVRNAGSAGTEVIIASRVDASPTSTPDVEPTVWARPTQASELLPRRSRTVQATGLRTRALDGDHSGRGAGRVPHQRHDRWIHPSESDAVVKLGAGRGAQLSTE